MEGYGMPQAAMGPLREAAQMARAELGIRQNGSGPLHERARRLTEKLVGLDRLLNQLEGNLEPEMASDKVPEYGLDYWLEHAERMTDKLHERFCQLAARIGRL